VIVDAQRPAGDRSAALLVRVWLEDGPGQFRARLTTTETSAGVGAPDTVTVAVASTPDAVVDAVRAWLDAFLVAGAS
jgi:hypothetical protein